MSDNSPSDAIRSRVHQTWSPTPSPIHDLMRTIGDRSSPLSFPWSPWDDKLAQIAGLFLGIALSGLGAREESGRNSDSIADILDRFLGKLNDIADTQSWDAKNIIRQQCREKAHSFLELLSQENHHVKQTTEKRQTTIAEAYIYAQSEFYRLIENAVRSLGQSLTTIEIRYVRSKSPERDTERTSAREKKIQEIVEPLIIQIHGLENSLRNVLGHTQLSLLP